MPKCKPIPVLSPKDIERFWSKVDRLDDDSCWPWIAGRSPSGYGRFAIGGLVYIADRISWVIHHGAIPGDLWVLHKCDNPQCCNPAHLFLGTPLDNTEDMKQKGRSATGARNGMNTHPERNRMRLYPGWVNPRPHPGLKGTSNPIAKLTDADVLEIRRRYADGTTQSEIARSFSINQTMVSHIVIGRSWRHLPGIVGRLAPRRGERSLVSKLRDSQVDEIRARYAAGGVSQSALAAEYGVTPSRVSQIVRGVDGKDAT